MGNGTILIQQGTSSAVFPAAAHSVYIYKRNTTTQVTVYADSGLSTPLTQPLTTTSGGSIPGYVSPSVGSLDAYDSTRNVTSQLNPLDAGSVVGADGTIGGTGSLGLPARTVMVPTSGTLNNVPVDQGNGTVVWESTAAANGVVGGSSGPPAWASTTGYTVNQAVTYGGVTFICVSSHTSGSSFPGVSGGKWAVLGSTYGNVPEIYGAAADGVTDDTSPLTQWQSSGKALALSPGKTYVSRGTAVNFSTAGQVIQGNGATLKRAPQAISSCDASQGTITAGSTTSVKVQAISGGSGATAWSFAVGDSVVIEQGGFFDPTARTVSSITGTGPYTVTVSAAFGSGTNNFTNNSTTQATLAGGTGATLRHGYNQFTVAASATDTRFRDTIFDGNSANWSWGRWQHTATFEAFSGADRMRFDHCVIQNQYGDGIDPGNAGVIITGCTFSAIKGRGVVFSGNVGNPTNFRTKVLFSDFINCNQDSNVAGSDGAGSVDFSQGGPSTLIHGCYFNGGVDGIGALHSTNGSHTTISNNEFWNLTGFGINGGGGGTPQATDSVVVHDNRLYGCSIIVNNNGSSGQIFGWDIHDNELVYGQIALNTGTDCQIHHNTLRSYQIFGPTSVTATAVAGGGTFAGGTTYFYALTATSPAGESTVGTEVSATPAANGSVNLTWNVVPGSGYKVYRTTTSGQEGTGSTLIATITNPLTTTFTDTNITPSASAAPASNSTWDQTHTLITVGVTGGTVKNCKVDGNVCEGGTAAIKLAGTGTINGCQISKNTCTDQFTQGINCASTYTDVHITGNPVTSNASSSGWDGIFLSGGETVEGNLIDMTAAGSQGIHVAGASFVRGNRINGGTITVTAAATKAVVENNVCTSAISDSGTSTRKANNRWTAGNFPTSGTATLVAGTVTVSTNEIQTGDNVTLNVKTIGGTPGTLSLGTIVNGTSFVINSSSGTDTSTIYWEIRH